MNRTEVLEAARHCVCGERQQDYGKPENNFANIAALWHAYTGHSYSPENVAIMLCLLKIARIKSGRKADNYIDLAGYAALAGELADLADLADAVPVPADPGTLGSLDGSGMAVNCRHTVEPVPADPGSPGPVEPAGDRPAGHSHRVTVKEIKLTDEQADELRGTLAKVLGGALDEAGRAELKKALGVKPCRPVEPAEPAELPAWMLGAVAPGMPCLDGLGAAEAVGTTHGEDMARPCPVDPVEAVARSLASERGFLEAVEAIGAAVARALEPVRKVWND